MKNLIFSNTNITLNDSQYITIVQGTAIIYSGLASAIVTTTYMDTVAAVTIGAGMVVVLQ